MKESVVRPFKAPIFSETFADEASVRRNGGININSSYLLPPIVNGIALFDGSKSDLYPNITPNTYSIRIKFKRLSLANTVYFWDCSNAGNEGTGYINMTATTGLIGKPSGTVYIDGVAASNMATTSKELIVTGMTCTGTSAKMSIGCRNNGANRTDGDIELLEIYGGTLTANEVKNLYEGKNNKTLSPHGEVLGVELIDQANWATQAYWNNLFGANWSADGTKLTSNGGIGFLSRTNFWVSGKTYKISITVTGTGNFYPPYTANFTIKTAPVTTYTEIVHVTNTPIFIYSVSLNGSITALSVKEVITGNAIPILSVDAYDGVIKNRMSGNYINGNLVPNIVNTAVTIVRDGSINAMQFNGTTSKLDCGSYDTLVGDKTFVAWVKNWGAGEGYSRYIDNGKLGFGISTVPRTWSRSDGVANKYGANPSYQYGQWVMVVVTRTSTGITNIYVNGVLSGTANESGGTPAAGTTNIIIGNTNAADSTHYGLIGSIRGMSGLLSTQEITQLFQTERKSYGV